MRAMRVIFVEDDVKDIREVKRVLRTTGLFQVEQVRDYAPLNDETIANTDLFVLDVFMEEEDRRDDRQFVDFVKAIACRKPFIAFTNLKSRGSIDTSGGPQQVREFIYSRGAVGLVTKSPPDRADPEHHWRLDMQYDLIERILMFYWSVRDSLEREQPAL